MAVLDFFDLELLERSFPYALVRFGDSIITILEAGLDFPISEEQDKADQWLRWLDRFSVSGQRIPRDLVETRSFRPRQELVNAGS